MSKIVFMRNHFLKTICSQCREKIYGYKEEGLADTIDAHKKLHEKEQNDKKCSTCYYGKEWYARYSGRPYVMCRITKESRYANLATNMPCWTRTKVR